MTMFIWFLIAIWLILAISLGIGIRKLVDPTNENDGYPFPTSLKILISLFVGAILLILVSLL